MINRNQHPLGPKNWVAVMVFCELGTIVVGLMSRYLPRQYDFMIIDIGLIELLLRQYHRAANS